MASKNHVLVQPFFLLVLRFVQAVASLAILGLTAYGVTKFAFDGDSLMLFTSIATIIIALYIIIAEMTFSSIYNYWAILGLDIFALIFWIVSLSLLADEIAQYSWVVTGSNDGGFCFHDYVGEYVCYKKRSVIARRPNAVVTYRNALAAACGLSGLEFILFVITLVFHSINLHRHRKAGGHCSPWIDNTNTAPAAPDAALPAASDNNGNTSTE